MRTTRILLLSGVIGLAACSSPTAPNSSQTAVPKFDPGSPGGHLQQFGPPCGTIGPKVLCSGNQ